MQILGFSLNLAAVLNMTSEVKPSTETSEPDTKRSPFLEAL